MGKLTWDRLSYSPKNTYRFLKTINKKTLQICQITVSHFKYTRNERQFLYNYMYKHLDSLKK